jgi:hypothetical protein
MYLVILPLLLPIKHYLPLHRVENAELVDPVPAVAHEEFKQLHPYMSKWRTIQRRHQSKMTLLRNQLLQAHWIA